MTLTGFHTLIILSLCWFASLIFRDKDKPKFFLAVLIIALVLAFTGLGSGETTSSETKNWQTPETHLAALVYEIGSPKAYGQIPQPERKAYSYYLAGKYKRALEIAIDLLPSSSKIKALARRTTRPSSLCRRNIDKRFLRSLVVNLKARFIPNGRI